MANFAIINQPPLSTPIPGQSSEEPKRNIYSLEFRLPPNELSGAPFGNYTVYVSADSQGYTGSAMTTFARENQTIADINCDHIVNMLDLVQVTARYGSKNGDVNRMPEVDVQPSGNRHFRCSSCYIKIRTKMLKRFKINSKNSLNLSPASY